MPITEADLLIGKTALTAARAAFDRAIADSCAAHGEPDLSRTEAEVVRTYVEVSSANVNMLGLIVRTREAGIAITQDLLLCAAQEG